MMVFTYLLQAADAMLLLTCAGRGFFFLYIYIHIYFRLHNKLIPQPFQPVVLLLRLPIAAPISISCSGSLLSWRPFMRNQWGSERETYL